MVLSPITHSDGEGNCRTKGDETRENERGKGRGHRANGAGRGRREEEGMIKVTERGRGTWAFMELGGAAALGAESVAALTQDLRLSTQ